MGLRCPHCGKQIPDELVSAHAGRGGPQLAANVVLNDDDEGRY